MKKGRLIAASIAAMALAAALFALVACSQPAASSSKSEEVLSVSETKVSSASQVSLSTEPFYVLIVGDDTRLGTVDITREDYADGSARSDTIMMCRVDPKTYQITLVTVPRDTQDWAFDRIGKINEVYQEKGIEGLNDAIEKLTGVRAKYYLDSTFVTFQDIINTMGGIHVNVPAEIDMKDIVSGEYMHLMPGEQDLNGAQALIFARERHAYGDDDAEAKRQVNDREIMKTIIQKILDDPTDSIGLATKLLGKVKTNWPVEEFTAYAKDFVANADKVHFVTGTGPYWGDFDPAADGIWLTMRDEETWHQVMDVVNQGGDPNTVMPQPTL